MGQKVNPHGFRVGVINDWNARWIAKKSNFADNIVEDDKIRKFIKKEYYAAGISKIEIERAVNKVSVNIYTGRPGVLIGKGGTGVEVIKAQMKKLTGKDIIINIIEVKRTDVDAQLVAENVAAQLEKRVSFRRAMKQVIQRTMKCGARGIKTSVSGRLNGADMARTEGYSEGKIPLQTLRADISYGFAEANTTYGKIGVKVWICRGEVLTKGLVREVKEVQAPADNSKKRKKPYNNNKREKK